MSNFKIISDFKPTGDQPEAIDKLVKGLNSGVKNQVLLGVTGSGKSVARDTSVVIRYPNGTIENVYIGEFVDGLFSKLRGKIRIINDSEVILSNDLPNDFRCMTYSFDPKGKMNSWKKITQLVRHHSPESLSKVTTSCGRQVIVTGDHNFFALKDGKLELLKTSELKKGYFLPVPLFFDKEADHIKSIYLPQYVTSNRRLYVAIDKFQAIWSIHQNILRPVLGSQKLHGIRVAGERVSYPLYQQLLSVVPELSDNVKIGLHSKDYGVAPELTLTNNLMRLLGYYLAEGHAERNYFTLSSGDEEIITDFAEIISELGLSISQRPYTYDYVTNSGLWSELISEWCGHNSQEKHLPPFWMQLSQQHLASLLSAYFSGDGGVNGVTVTCITASSRLVSDLMYALLRFGIIARVRERSMKVPNQKKRRRYYEMMISGQKYLKIFVQKIGFTLTQKQEKLSGIICNSYNTNVDIIPVSSAWVKQVRRGLGLSQKQLGVMCGCNRSFISMIEGGKRLPSRDSFIKLVRSLKLTAYRQNSMILLSQVSEQENLLNLFWSPIKSIEKVNGEEYVYDFAVEHNETFLAGRGGLFVHNTFTMANVIQAVQKPTLVISHNKTLAGQLAQEFRSIFPENAVEYFVSYYDYYQPEAYIPSSDTYIEKDASINEEIEKLRLSATTSLMTRRDVLVVASVSCIYNLGSPEEYGGAVLHLKEGVRDGFDTVLKMLTRMFYARNDIDFQRGTFRVKGDTVDIFPAYSDSAVRVQFLGNVIERVSWLDPVSGSMTPTSQIITLYPAKHYVTPQDRIKPAIKQIEKDLNVRLKQLRDQNKLVEAQRLEQRTNYDLEMIREYGYCNGIENYSRYFDGREIGDTPYSLLEYFPKDFLVIVDESHITLPQVRGMYNGDRARKETLIDFGFRLPSALDNRPLKFEEFQRKVNQAIYVSATPDEFELSLAGQNGVAEQLVRPTGIIDPEIEVRPSEGQITDVLREVESRIQSRERVLITTLTKRMAEDLSDYLAERGIKVNYLHSDIETLKRSDILQSLRLGEYDVIVGINLLREGLDLPEVSLVVILDADKEGFLRSRTSLVQTMGRAARHVNGKVIMYADTITRSMKAAIDEVDRRREYQLKYNKTHNITPKSITKALRERLIEKIEEETGEEVQSINDIPESERKRIVKSLEDQMKEAANTLDFESAAKLRDQIKELSV